MEKGEQGKRKSRGGEERRINGEKGKRKKRGEQKER